MVWLLGGYMWLYVHRPFEVWPALGSLQIERGYMLLMILSWLVSPGKALATNRIHVALASFAFALLAAWLFSPFAGMPGTWEVIDNFVKVSVFYVLVVTSVRDEKSLRLLVLLAVGAVGMYLAHSAYEFLCGRYQYRQGIRRMMGVDLTYADPNAFASTLLYSLPLLLPFWFEKPRRVPRWLLLGFATVAIGSILLTGSRAGFMGLVVLGVLFCLMTAKRKIQAILFGAPLAGLALIVLSVALPGELQGRYLTLLDSSRGPTNAQQSADGRIEGLIRGVQAWQRSPLVGHGPAAFVYATRGTHQAHNLYGQVLAELGSLGAAALALLVLCFWLNWRETRRLVDSETASGDFVYHLSRSITLNVALLLVMGCAGHNLFRYNWQWYAAFSAVAVHCLRRRSVTAPEFAFAEPYAAPALLVGG